MKVSVIIPTFNDGDRLQQCLTALSHQTYKDYEIIVVDNNSTEDIYSICNKLGVRYCFELKPGNNAARNKGIENASGEIIAITDTDCIPDANWIVEGVRSLQEHPRAGVVGGAINLFAKGKRFTPIEYADFLSYLRQKEYCEQEHYAAGANLFTWRKVIDRVGGFEDRLLNMGDKEWGQRVHAAGFEVIYCPTAVVWHPARATLRELLSKARRQTRANWKLQQLKGQKVSISLKQFLPLGLRFWRMVLRDETLPNLVERLQFGWVIHRLKWAIACQQLQLLLSPQNK